MTRVMIFVHPSLDLFDSLYEARMAGQEAGLKGQLKGENPYPCECHRSQWDRGWQEGSEMFARTSRLVIIPDHP